MTLGQQKISRPSGDDVYSDPSGPRPLIVRADEGSIDRLRNTAILADVTACLCSPVEQVGTQRGPFWIPRSAHQASQACSIGALDKVEQVDDVDGIRRRLSSMHAMEDAIPADGLSLRLRG